MARLRGGTGNTCFELSLMSFMTAVAHLDQVVLLLRFHPCYADADATLADLLCSIAVGSHHVLCGACAMLVNI